MDGSQQADTNSQRGVGADHGLASASFGGLLLTQLLTAINDNTFRWLAIGLGKQALEEAGDEEHIGLILMAGTACFVLPYLVLAAPAGYLADRFSKRTVIISCKVAEIVLATLGIGAMLSGNVVLLLAVVALFGMQSALFSPSRLGSIPELLPVEKISAANGLMGLTTVIATVIGMALGNVLADLVGQQFTAGIAASAAALIGCALFGTLASLWITGLPAAAPELAFPLNPLPKMAADLRELAARRPLLRVALGIVFFWSVGALAQLNIDQFAFESGATRQTQIVPLLLALVAGVGIGSVLAGYWSAGRVELGILPLGAAGLVLNAVLLFFVPEGVMLAGATWLGYYGWTALLLFALGVSAGLFDVPLESYLQHHSPPQSRGSVLAASNLLTFSGILGAAVLFAALRAPLRGEEPLLTARQIFLFSGLLTIPVFFYILWLIPQASLRFLVWLSSKTMYRIRVYGHENLPERGGALLVANHVSWLDGPLMLLTSSRPVRVLAFTSSLQHRGIRRLAERIGVVLVSPQPQAVRAALRTAQQALRNGELVCIFPEGAITRSGQMQAFRPGLLRVLKGTGVPVVPVYLDELWGSVFSFRGGKFFWKWPERWPYPISIFFGRPVDNPMDVHQVRQAVQALGATAVERRASRASGLGRSFVRTCKKRKRGSKIADSLGNELSGGGLLARSLILRRLLLRNVLADDESFVGLLLPPSVAGVVANMACTLARRVPVNLNYTVTSDVINECIQQSGIRHVITSRQFLERVKLDVAAELVYLEDFRSKAGLWDKLACAIAAYAVPAPLLERSLGLHRVHSDDLATVIFTSGSTGLPKGVMLTQTNVGSNVDAIEQIIHLHRTDVLVGVLPFFHSFGYTVCLWAAMSIDVKGVYHFNPLEAKVVGKLVKKHGGTVMLATPTFLRTYLRRCEPDELETLDAVVAGAEKLPKDLCDAFEAKFGIRPVEGYGTTELSPLVSANIPASRSPSGSASDCKEGTVGRPVPGISAKVTDLDTGQQLGAGRPGMLWIKGPNVMKGYLGRDDLTAEVIQDGWYMTGDIAVIDEDGFIQITGRQSRFSKIGGEMVPHLLIEEGLAQIIGIDDEEGFRAVVTAIVDERKGERIVVLHKAISKTPEELRRGLSELGFPNLYIPSEDSFFQVEAIPVLGTGKLDLRGIKQMANEVSQADPNR
jgi:acyl-[acyl-carrier-protein]-phospholipid O-acyltransferase / long-chain-fatty-acid--[acyl-carrier-protein] ligase